MWWNPLLNWAIMTTAWCVRLFSSVTSGLLNQLCDEHVLWILGKSTIENVIKLDSQLSHHGDRVVRANIIFQCETLPSYRPGASSSLIVSSSSIVSPFFEFPMFNAVDSNIRFLNESSGDSKLFLGCVNVRCVFKSLPAFVCNQIYTHSWTKEN